MSTENGKQEENKFKIKVIQDGPYLVTGGVPLSEQSIGIDSDNQIHGWIEGNKYLVRETYALCRCGHSKNKPFCDGSHAKVNFDGTETASHKPYLDRAQQYMGPDLTLTDVKEFCIGIGFCHRAGGTWNLTHQSGDPDAKQIAIEEAGDCPSGRLVTWDINGKAIEPELEPSIGLVVDTRTNQIGPLWVRGCIPIESADGKTYEVRNRVTLCCCGKSSNKPFCDGSHLE